MSSWSTTFHTYGVLIMPDYTAYYLDDIEVLRHPSGQLSATLPISFLVNLAIGGGGWKPNLQRYGDQSDMWVDYVRVYQGAQSAATPSP
jgi:beta-glucanase (GH16 family)